jgi:hypothetical protein
MEQLVRHDDEIVRVYAPTMGDTVAAPATAGLLDPARTVLGVRYREPPEPDAK